MVEEVKNIESVTTSYHDLVDKFEVGMLANYPVVDCPLVHRFTKDTYTREILMEAGMLITSKIHLLDHPYFILQGKVSVFTEDEGEVTLEAPHIGITKAGTRRVLYIHERTIWATVHTLSKEGETLEEIENRIIQKHENQYLQEISKQILIDPA